VGTSTAANLTYAYDRADRVTQITYPSGRIVGYVRDSKGRITTVRTKALSSVTTWTNLATAMQYEPFAALKQATLGNTLSMTVNWGNDGRLASRRLYKTSGAANLSLLSYAYDHDANGTRRAQQSPTTA
jgi:YD repeat-containing protein